MDLSRPESNFERKGGRNKSRPDVFGNGTAEAEISLPDRMKGKARSRGPDITFCFLQTCPNSDPKS